MKRASLIASAAVVVAANVFVLVHGLRNRMSVPEAEITLTQRELPYFSSLGREDDSGVILHLEWIDPGNFTWPAQVQTTQPWLDQQVLERLGFDCSLDASKPDAGRYYQRQRSRQVFVALEFDGAAWRAWRETYERGVAEQRARTQSKDFTDDVSSRSHLVAVAADLDRHALRARYPDRGRVIIVPAVVAIMVQPFPYAGVKLDPKIPVRFQGRVQELPSSIHVPRPFSDEFRRQDQNRSRALNTGMSYQVRLRYGRSLEPWVTGVQFQK